MALAFTDVRKTYGAVVALEGVSLTVEPGTVHCLAGPNGSGKTTLLRVALGLTRPTAGSVAVSDGRIGATFQTPSVFADLTVAENLATVAALTGRTDPDRRRRIEARLGLTDVRNRVARDLSAGYRKRLDLAAGILPGHAYLLCDEPLADVDAPARQEIVDLLAERDAAVLVATHDVDAFGGVCDRLTVLVDGQVALDQPAAAHDGRLSDQYAGALRDVSATGDDAPSAPE